jgi:beta-lactamase regulating signal transducer with metallopeptidase domain
MFDALAHLQANWIGSFLLRVSICTLIILLARRALANRWGAQIPRLLWIILIVRCLVPWTQPIQYHPAGLLAFKDEQVALAPPSPSSEPMAANTELGHSVSPRPVSQVPRASSPVAQESSAYGPGALVGLWISGVLAVLLATYYQSRRITSRAIAHAVSVPNWIQEILHSCRDQLGIRHCPELIISPHITSPCLAGVVRPRILLPSTLLEDTTESEMRHILLHECIHLQQKDIWYAWLWTITLALHWFNPLLWWAGRRLSQDCEAACDERVLAVLDPDKRISYGQSLLALAQRLRPTARIQPGFVCIIEHASRIERRLTMIKNYHKRKVPILGKLALIGFTVLVLTSYAAQQAKPPADPGKAELMGRVEELFLNKFKHVSMRKSLQWDLAKNWDYRHRSIRYKYEALFPGQERRVMNQVFIFDRDGNYVGHETLPRARGKMHPLVRNFVTVKQDGGPGWQTATAIKNNTWFVGHFSKRRDERWYQLEVSADVTYTLFVDDENGSGKYNADPAFEIYEQRVDRSTRVVLDHRGGYYMLPLGYRPQRNGTAYVRIVSHNPQPTSFAFGYTELPEENKAAAYDILMGLPSILFEDGMSARFMFEDNGLDYQPISTPTEFENPGFRLGFLGLAKDGTSLYIKLAYDSPTFSRIGVRLAGDRYGLKQFLPVGTRKGKNLLVIQLETRKVLAYPTHICVEIGDGRSVRIDKDIVNEFLRTPRTAIEEQAFLESAGFSFKDNGLDYQPINKPNGFINKGFKLNFLGLAKDDTFLYIKLMYASPIQARVGVRLAGDKDVSDAHGLYGFLPYGTEVGNNLLIIKQDINKVAEFPTHICVEIGDDRSVVIKKDVVDAFLEK